MQVRALSNLEFGNAFNIFNAFAPFFLICYSLPTALVGTKINYQIRMSNHSGSLELKMVKKFRRIPIYSYY